MASEVCVFTTAFFVYIYRYIYIYSVLFETFFLTGAFAHVNKFFCDACRWFLVRLGSVVLVCLEISCDSAC